MKKIWIPIMITAIVATGCSSGSSDQSETSQPMQQPKFEYVMGSNDWSVITSQTDSPNILEAYQFAVEHPDVLNYMPCYCGCFEEDGHTSNTNCFVESIDNNVAQLDTMGFG